MDSLRRLPADNVLLAEDAQWTSTAASPSLTRDEAAGLAWSIVQVQGFSRRFRERDEDGEVSTLQREMPVAGKAARGKRRRRESPRHTLPGSSE